MRSLRYTGAHEQPVDTAPQHFARRPMARARSRLTTLQFPPRLPAANG